MPLIDTLDLAAVLDPPGPPLWPWRPRPSLSHTARRGPPCPPTSREVGGHGAMAGSTPIFLAVRTAGTTAAPTKRRGGASRARSHLIYTMQPDGRRRRGARVPPHRRERLDGDGNVFVVHLGALCCGASNTDGTAVAVKDVAHAPPHARVGRAAGVAPARRSAVMNILARAQGGARRVGGSGGGGTVVHCVVPSATGEGGNSVGKIRGGGGAAVFLPTTQCSARASCRALRGSVWARGDHRRRQSAAVDAVALARHGVRAPRSAARGGWRACLGAPGRARPRLRRRQ